MGTGEPSVRTGAEANTLRWWHVASGVISWVTAVCLVGWFLGTASSQSIQTSAAIAGTAVLLAMVAIVVAVQVLRPRLIRQRLVQRGIPPAVGDVDQLGRRLRDPQSWPALTGELVMTEDELGVRRPLEWHGDRP